MAPDSAPASVLHASFGLRENFGSGRLLAGGASSKTEPENVLDSGKESREEGSGSFEMEMDFGSSFGSGPLVPVPGLKTLAPPWSDTRRVTATDPCRLITGLFGLRELWRANLWGFGLAELEGG